MRVPFLVGVSIGIVLAASSSAAGSGPNATYRLLGPGNPDVVLACDDPAGTTPGCDFLALLGYDGYNAVHVESGHLEHPMTCAVVGGLLVTSPDALHWHDGEGPTLLHLHDGADVTVACSL